MAIDRPGAIDPHPKGRSIAESGGRRLFCFARNGAQRQGKIVVEGRCGQAIERAARPSARSAQRRTHGTAEPRQSAKRSHRLRHPPAPTMRTAPRQDRPHLLALRRAWRLRHERRPPAPASRRGRDASSLRRPKRLAVTTAGPRVLHTCFRCQSR